MTSLIFLVFPALMLMAAISDVRKFLIPNSLTAAIAVSWPFAAMLAGIGWDEAGVAIALAFAMLVAGFTLFAAGWLGGGDAKLIPAATLWLAPAGLTTFLLTTVLAGAVLAIVLLFFRKIPLPAAALSADWVVGLHGRQRDIPYGVAITAGALNAWRHTPFFPF